LFLTETSGSMPAFHLALSLNSSRITSLRYAANGQTQPSRPRRHAPRRFPE
jgi:hypothetical protein